MERVYGLIDSSMLITVDDAAKAEGLSRARWIGIAIEAYLHHSDDNGDEKSDESNQKLMNMGIALDEQARSIAHLEDVIRRQDDEILHLRDMTKLLTGKIIPALLIIQDTPKPKKPRWKFW